MLETKINNYRGVIVILLLVLLIISEDNVSTTKAETGKIQKEWELIVENVDYGGLTVIQTSDGGFAYLGISIEGFKLVKIDSTGQIEWNKTLLGQEPNPNFVCFSEKCDLIQTNDGGYIIGGSAEYNPYLIKTNSLGDVEWNYTYPFGKATAGEGIIQTNDSGFILVGFFLINNFDSGVFMFKTDKNGVIEWNKTFQNLSNDIVGASISEIIQTSDGGFALGGGAGTASNGVDFLVMKTDFKGNIVWNRTYGGGGNEQLVSIFQTADNGYALGGSIENNGNYDLWLVKTNQLGKMLWNDTFGGSEDECGWNAPRAPRCSMIQASDGGYIFVSSTQSYEAQGTDILLLKTNETGQVQWDWIYGGSQNEFGNTLVQTSDGGIVFGGSTKSSMDGFGLDMLLVKITVQNPNSTSNTTASSSGLAITILVISFVSLFRKKKKII